MHQQDPYWSLVWQQFRQHRLGCVALIVVSLFILIGVYAPLLASGVPLFVAYEGNVYFPLLRLLFFQGYFTKNIDLFFNLCIFTLPLFLGSLFFLRRYRKAVCSTLLILQLLAFSFVASGWIKDPLSTPALTQSRQTALLAHAVVTEDLDPLLAPFPFYPSWQFDLKYLNAYAQLDLLFSYQKDLWQRDKLQPYAHAYQQLSQQPMPILWELNEAREHADMAQLTKTLQANEERYRAAKAAWPALVAAYQPYVQTAAIARQALTEARERYQTLRAQQKQLFGLNAEASTALEQARQALTHEETLFNVTMAQLNPLRAPLIEARHAIIQYEQAQVRRDYLIDKQAWMDQQLTHLHFEIWPFIRHFHWQEDVGGNETLNQIVPWTELTRSNHKDLLAALLFGVRVSLVVGFLAISLALLIGIPIGAYAGYYGGKFDIIVCRLIEVWESMPTFFMLLMIIAITQTKSIFLIIGIIGAFGWPSFSRYIRGEFLKQRHRPYVEACHSMGFPNRRIIFSHILPNAIPPLLTLLPFAIMAAITSEAALSFLGLGEEGSCSWGVLMDEGRNAFPAASQLLWPPAIALTVLLIAIALVGDAIRDALDPKLRKA